jgi:flavin-dependent dehydrogenase
MNLPILDRLGVLGEVRKIGVPKYGADFTVGNSGDEEKVFYFANALGNSPTQAFEVRRSEFDHLLFERARRAGVSIHEGTRVVGVTVLPNNSHEIESIDEKGTTQLWEARFLVDASGRDTVLSGRNGWKSRNSKHTSAALFGHFRSVERRAGTDAGNISLYWFEHGWIWMIPLQDDIMSVGAVCRPEYLKTRNGSLDDFLLQTLGGISEVRERMTQAALAMPAQATGNFSYQSDRMFGPGFLLIGDAYAFIDPVFSSGVYLAMNSAEQGVGVVEAWLSGNPAAYRKACRQFEKNVRQGLSVFSWFIYRFTSPAMSLLMSNPRNVLKVMQAVISMLAGDVFTNRALRRRLIIFKAIYAASWTLSFKESLRDYRLKKASVRESGA